MKTFVTLLAAFATALVIISTADAADKLSLSCTAFAQATTPTQIYAKRTGSSFQKAHEAAITACRVKGGENCSIYLSWCVHEPNFEAE